MKNLFHFLFNSKVLNLYLYYNLITITIFVLSIIFDSSNLIELWLYNGIIIIFSIPIILLLLVVEDSITADISFKINKTKLGKLLFILSIISTLLNYSFCIYIYLGLCIQSISVNGWFNF